MQRIQINMLKDEEDGPGIGPGKEVKRKGLRKKLRRRRGRAVRMDNYGLKEE